MNWLLICHFCNSSNGLWFLTFRIEDRIWNPILVVFIHNSIQILQSTLRKTAKSEVSLQLKELSDSTHSSIVLKTTLQKRNIRNVSKYRIHVTWLLPNLKAGQEPAPCRQPNARGHVYVNQNNRIVSLLLFWDLGFTVYLTLAQIWSQSHLFTFLQTQSIWNEPMLIANRNTIHIVADVHFRSFVLI